MRSVILLCFLLFLSLFLSLFLLFFITFYIFIDSCVWPTDRCHESAVVVGILILFYFILENRRTDGRQAEELCVRWMNKYCCVYVNKI